VAGAGAVARSAAYLLVEQSDDCHAWVVRLDGEHYVPEAVAAAGETLVGLGIPSRSVSTLTRC
jgi:hypothetical protein